MKKRSSTRNLLTTGILGLALLSLVPLAAQARCAMGGPHRSPDQALERITRQLELTDEQQEKVQAVLEASFEQRQAMRDQHRQDRDSMRAATEDQLAEFLTEEQMDELRNLREDRHDRRRGCDQGKGCGNCPQAASD